jgi:hypothetical protein
MYRLKCADELRLVAKRIARKQRDIDELNNWIDRIEVEYRRVRIELHKWRSGEYGRES